MLPSTLLSWRFLRCPARVNVAVLQGLLEREASADVGAKLVELDLRASLAPRARLVFRDLLALMEPLEWKVLQG